SLLCYLSLSFLSNRSATTELYTLSLHDALPIFIGDAQIALGGDHLVKLLYAELPQCVLALFFAAGNQRADDVVSGAERDPLRHRSEEHTSELQSRENLVCRLLLEKKKKKKQS